MKIKKCVCGNKPEITTHYERDNCGDRYPIKFIKCKCGLRGPEEHFLGDDTSSEIFIKKWNKCIKNALSHQDQKRS